MADKAEGAFLTIGELADRLGLPQHILRYWETRFPQLRPLQRAGKRRYYRPEDVALAMRIDRLLNQEGYTIKGVQKLLAQKGAAAGIAAPEPQAPPQPQSQPAPQIAAVPAQPDLIPALRRLRAQLAEALALA